MASTEQGNIFTIKEALLRGIFKKELRDPICAELLTLLKESKSM